MSRELNQEKRFEKKLKLRVTAGIWITLAGLVTVAGSIWLTKGGILSEQMIGFYTGLGGGLVGAGIVTFIKNRQLQKNENKRRQKQLEEYDERNLYLRSCTMTYSGYVLVAILYLGMIVTGFFNETVSSVLLSVLGIYLVLIFVINLILRRFS